MIPRDILDENSFPFRPFEFEAGGRIYERIGIKSWMNRLPDMSRIFPRLMPTKKLDAKLIWRGTGGAIVTAVYEIFNFLFILIQRYTRPRLIWLYERVLAKEACAN